MPPHTKQGQSDIRVYLTYSLQRIVVDADKTEQ